MATHSEKDVQDGKLAGTAKIALAMQREPPLLVRVMHELSRSEDAFPDLLACADIASNESVVSIRDVQPKVLDYHLHGFQAVRVTVDEIKGVLPWACLPYTSAMITLSRGFFPKLYMPNALYAYLAASTERALRSSAQAPLLAEDAIARALPRLQDMREAVESLWRLKFPRIAFKFGPVAMPDLLASVSAYDDMIVFHPVAPLSHCWPGVAVAAMSRLLLQKHQPRLDERVKDQLSLLTCLAALGAPLLLPGTCHDVLSRHPVDHAQYQVESIAKDLALCGTFDNRLLHFFPAASMNENYSVDMVRSIITLIIEDDIDERELFARVSASNVGYRPFDLNFILFQKALAALERSKLVKREEPNNQVIVVGDPVAGGVRRIT
ncbi:MAG: hypothetical protein JW839_14665 [Candidatus Lokiarchaeota archaeon]|nr:hypothetical protein [Candidatus Lokiarchaeota archaeon]